MGGYLYFKLDDEITRYSRSFFSEHYAHLDVRVASARYAHGTGVILSGVSFAQPQADGSFRPLLEVEELRLIGALDRDSLSTHRPRIDRIEFHRPKLTATKLANGQWSVQALLPPPQGDDSAPPAPLHIFGATIVLTDETKPGAQPLTLRNVSLAMKQTPTADGPGRIDIQGRAEDSLARLIEFQGNADADGGRVDMEVDVKQLGLTTDRLLAIPGLPAFMLVGLSIDGKVDAHATIQRQSLVTPLDWQCDFTLNRCTLSHPFLPKQLTEVEITGKHDPKGFRIDKAKAKSGEAELTGMLQTLGWGPEARASCQLNVNGLALDANLYRSLPESLKRTWDRFEPRGEIDAKATLWFSAGRVWSDVTVSGRELSFTDTRKFNYRVDAGTGSIRYVDKTTPEQSRLVIRIDAQAEGRPLNFHGDFLGVPSAATRAGQCPVGQLRVTSNAMRVTERLLSALPVSCEPVLRKLNPEGEFGITWTMRRDSLEQPEPTFAMDMLIHDGSIRFKHFPYPIRGIRGRVEQRGKQWRFLEFTTRGEDGGPALAAAGLLDATAGPCKLTLNINGAGLSLDETLRAALPADQRKAWAALRPHGRVGFESSLEYTAGDLKPKLTIKVKPHGQTVSIYPTFFPYRLENVQGEFVATGDEMRFIAARAKHGITRFHSDGIFQALPNAGWRFELSDLSIDRLNLNEDFRAAAPVGLRKVLNRLEPDGGLGVHHGKLSFLQSNPNQPLQTTWDMQVDCQQLDINAGVRVEDLFGMVRITGSGSGDTGVSQGELALDSLIWNGLQLTKINGPFYCDATRCLVGTGAAEKLRSAPRPVMAQAYGGVATMDGFAIFEGRPRYGMQVSLNAIDLARVSSDYLHNSANLTGKLDGKLQLQGTGNTIFGLTGSGELVAHDADLYELPVLVSMLKVLRNRSPNTTAFDSVEAKFTLRGEYLEFQQLDLLGDAISLYGRGSAGLDRNVNLVFHSLVGRKTFIAPIRALAGQASEQLLKLKVTGLIEDAQVTGEPLPLVSNMFRQFQSDLRPQPLTQPSDTPAAAAQRR